MINKVDRLHEYIQDIDTNEDRNEILKKKYEQYYTSSTIANYMASFFNDSKKSDIKILDPGAGLGSLTIAFVLATFKWKSKPKRIHAILYEIDINVKFKLESRMKELARISLSQDINFSWKVIYTNFIEDGVKLIKNENFEIFDYIILNPPYKKMSSGSFEDKLLLHVGINVSNYYAAFVSLSNRFLKHNGEIVAITPRSFCNGVYFNKFREDIKSSLRFVNIHLFDSRTSAFKKDDVLQETIIYHCVKQNWDDNKKVKIYHSTDDTFSDITSQNLKLNELIYPSDQNMTIRIAKSVEDVEISSKIESLPCSILDLGIEISTGPIVDFREGKGLLNEEVREDSIPFLCPNHIKDGTIKWPRPEAKYNSIMPDKKIINKLRPTGNYVLVKRISSKEEKRRIVASVVEAEKFKEKFLAFDNKTNYFHRNKEGVELDLAIGICIYINSSIVDMYFRIFSGHTQVNATDLRSIRYPNKITLEKLGRYGHEILLNQEDIDRVVNEVVF